MLRGEWRGLDDGDVVERSTGIEGGDRERRGSYIRKAGAAMNASFSPSRKARNSASEMDIEGSWRHGA